jgi:proline utilization trans-activator
MQYDSPSPSSLPSKARRRGRVPDQLRKRAAVSCDFCKIRRRKCVRDSSDDPCKLCRENNVECGSTIPRKSRNPTTAAEDGLSPSASLSHYRAMEDLVNKLFPGVSTDDTDELVRLSQGVENGSVAFLRDHLPSSASGATLNGSSPTSCTSVNDHDPFGIPKSSIPPSKDQAKSLYTANLYERMLQNTLGTLSYFGHSSSMAYVRKMRELLLALGAKHGSGSLPDTQQRLRDSFIQDKYAHTMGDNQDSVPDLRTLGSLQQHGGGFDVPWPTAAASARVARLLEILPNKEETEDLVELFFVHVHVNMPLFHRSSCQAVLDRLRSHDPGTIDAGWAVCLRLIVAFGCESRLSTLSQQGDHPDSLRLASLGKQLVSDSLAEIPQLMLSATLQTVTALALFSIYLSFANERNAAWVLNGCAIRMAIGLGLHRGEDLIRRSHMSLTLADKELRKQIWCSLYIYEQYTSSLFGRPSAVDGVEILVDLPKESILEQGFYQPPGLLHHDISLARIIGKIRGVQIDQSLQPSNDCHGLPDVDMCNQLLKELECWEEGLPIFLRFDETQSHHIYPNHFRQIVMMHVRYQYARILLSRPFLLKALFVSDVLKPTQALDERIAKYKHVCFLAASNTCALIRCIWKNGQYNARLWLDGVFAYQCTLILSLYLLDSSKASDDPQHQELERMVQQMQDILQKEPGNSTMRRLVQISHDFTQIVKSIPLGSRENESCNTSGSLAQAAQDPVTYTQNPCDIEPNLSNSLNASNVPLFNWDTLVGETWLHEDFMEGNYRVDMSITDFDLSTRYY